MAENGSRSPNAEMFQHRPLARQTRNAFPRGHHRTGRVPNRRDELMRRLKNGIQGAGPDWPGQHWMWVARVLERSENDRDLFMALAARSSSGSGMQGVARAMPLHATIERIIHHSRSTCRRRNCRGAAETGAAVRTVTRSVTPSGSATGGAVNSTSAGPQAPMEVAPRTV